jgi:hypothetical protein
MATRASSNTTRCIAAPLRANAGDEAGDGGGDAPAEAPSAAAPVARLEAPLSANAARRGNVLATVPRASDDARAGRARRGEGQARPARRTAATGATRARVGVADIAGRVQVWAGWTRRTKASAAASWQLSADCQHVDKLRRTVTG